MKKHLGIILGILILLGIGYGAGIGYYAERFQANTKFGSIDISGLNYDQAKEKIETEINKKKVTLKDAGKEVGSLTIGDLKGKIDTDNILKAKYNSQDPRLWIKGYFTKTYYDDVLSNRVQFDSEELQKALDELGLNNDKRTPSKDAKIDYTDSKGYFVQPESQGNQIDIEIAQTMLVNALQKGQGTVELNKAYAVPQLKEDDHKITETMDAIKKATETKVNLKISGETITIPAKEIEKWIVFDKKNQITYSQKAVQDYVKTLNAKYSTFDKVREFDSTLSGVVQIQPGTLGWSIDSETESNQIIKDLKAKKEVTRDVNVVGSGYDRGENDIGDTYVEVDIANQTMFIYKNGKKVLETPIVSGRPGSSDTIPGAYAIWSKERNATLRGINAQTGKKYASPVQYWMPFDTIGQGIHDAAWQSSFGGQTLNYSGSQGCINVSPSVMPTVFDTVDNGTPVIVF